MRRSSQRAWRGREALLESREGSGGIRSLCRKAGRIGRLCRYAGRCCKALPKGQVVFEGPPGGLGGVGSPIRMVEGLEALAKGPRGVRSP